jgi:putative transposase
MPRAIRCNLPNHPYECTTRTVNEQYLLNPFAAPGRFAFEHDFDSFDDIDRLKQDALIAERNAEKLQTLIGQIKAWRDGQGPEPVVTADTLPETVNNIIGAWLAKAIAHTGVDYYGLICMSNHPHHIVSHKDGKIEKFFEYFNGQVAKALNRFHGRHHQVWSRRYSAIPILDEQADIERLVYLLTNPQKADLVDIIEQWPGLSSAPVYLGHCDEPNEFLFFDRTAWDRAKRPKAIAKFLQVVSIKYTILPGLAHLPEEERKALARRRLTERETELRDERRSEGKTVVGIEDLKMNDSKTRPKNPKRGRMPLCHCTDKELKILFITARYIYANAYREQTRKYMETEMPGDLELPLGSYPPPKLMRYRYPGNPECSMLPNLSVR